MEHSVKLRSLLAKSTSPLSDLELEVQVCGVYSLPDQWKPGEVESADYTYQISVSGSSLSTGKLKRRQMTEEELQSAEEAKKGKKDPGKKKGEGDLTAEELQEQERRRLERLETERKQEEAMKEMTESQRFYFIQEDIFQNPCLVWEESGEFDAIRISLSEKDLLDFEEQVEDLGGIYVQVHRLLKISEEEAKKKAKGKGAEELKPSYSQGWLDLTPLRNPGQTTYEIRIKLEDQAVGEETESVFANSNSYVYLKVKLSSPITPLDAKDPPVIDEELVQEPNISKLPSTSEASKKLRQEIKIAALSIASEYAKMFSETADNQRKLAVSRQNELRESRKDSFLYEVSLSGQLLTLKNKLKKCIVDIAREKFRKTGISSIDKEAFLAELYSYVIEQVNMTTDELLNDKKESIHEDIILPKEKTARDKEVQASRAMKETPDERLFRIAYEQEFQENPIRASQCLKERICRDPQSINIWMDYVRFALRQGDIERAEEGLLEAMNLHGEPPIDKVLLMGAIKLQRKRFVEAEELLQQAISRDFTNVWAHLMAYLLYKVGHKALMERKHLLIAKQLLMRHLGMLPPKRGVKNTTISSLEKYPAKKESNTLTEDHLDELFFTLTEYFVNEKLMNLAILTIGELSSDSSDRCLLLRAQILYWQEDYRSCVSVLNDLISGESSDDRAWALKGSALFKLESSFDAEDSFLRSLKIAPRTPKGNKLSEHSVFLRLGQIYLKRRAWVDAKAVFSKCCAENPTAIAWEGLGIACIQLGELQIAEDALITANMMDEDAPDTWLAMALMSLKSSKTPPGRFLQYSLCLNKAIEKETKNPNLLTWVAHEYLEGFFTTGVEGVEAYDSTDIVACYTRAARCLRDQGKSVRFFVDGVAAKFDEVQLDIEKAKHVKEELIEELMKFDA